MQSDETKRLIRQPSQEGLTEPTTCGRVKDTRGAPQAPSPSVGQCRRGENTAVKQTYNMTVPVVSKDSEPLMPTTASRARRWIRSGEATPFFVKGVFCVRLNREPSANEKQQIAVGIDPGSKKEGFTVKSASHTYLNIQADAVTWVKEAVETKRMLRQGRRSRKTPCRKNKANRSRGGLPPSTRARWNWKLRISIQLAKIYPITDFVVEDIKAMSKKNCRKWNKSFSPLEVGKTYFYAALALLGTVHLKQGWETKALRDALGLKKTSQKLSEKFEAHCVDSWVLANWLVGGHTLPENKQILFISPIRLHRRQLHAMVPAKGGKRRPYGSTRSMGFKRGALVKHLKWGLTYVGGTQKSRISLHSLVDGKRLCKVAKLQDTQFKSYNTWRVHLFC